MQSRACLCSWLPQGPLLKGARSGSSPAFCHGTRKFNLLVFSLRALVRHSVSFPSCLSQIQYLNNGGDRRMKGGEGLWEVTLCLPALTPLILSLPCSVLPRRHGPRWSQSMEKSHEVKECHTKKPTTHMKSSSKTADLRCQVLGCSCPPLLLCGSVLHPLPAPKPSVLPSWSVRRIIYFSNSLSCHKYYFK